MTYDSFGNIVAETGSAAAEEVCYTGREWEDEFGLYYYRARYYDPLTGRFMSGDPLGPVVENLSFRQEKHYKTIGRESEIIVQAEHITDDEFTPGYRLIRPGLVLKSTLAPPTPSLSCLKQQIL